MEPVSLRSPALASKFFTTCASWEAIRIYMEAIYIYGCHIYIYISHYIYIYIKWYNIVNQLYFKQSIRKYNLQKKLFPWIISPIFLLISLGEDSEARDWTKWTFMVSFRFPSPKLRLVHDPQQQLLSGPLGVWLMCWAQDQIKCLQSPLSQMQIGLTTLKIQLLISRAEKLFLAPLSKKTRKVKKRGW